LLLFVLLSFFWLPATEYHLGLLKAKLAKYRAQLLEPTGKSGAKVSSRELYHFVFTVVLSTGAEKFYISFVISTIHVVG